MAKKDSQKTIQFRCEVSMLARFQAEAKKQGMTFSNFIRYCMAKECEARELDRQKAKGHS